MKWLLLVSALSACACPPKPSAGPGAGSTTGSAGSGSGGATLTGCASIQGRVEQLYRAEAQAKEPTRVDQAVADNTAMVLRACGKAADQPKFTACVASAPTAKELEGACLPPLDDEGTEGDALKPAP